MLCIVRRLLLAAAVLLCGPAGAADKPYYAEARWRPAPGAHTPYVAVRYADASNWLGFGLELAADGRKLSVNIVRVDGGQVNYLKQVRTEPDAPGSGYTLRLDVDGTALTMYLNGTRLIGTDEGSLLPQRVLQVGAPGAPGAAAAGSLLSLRTGDATLPATSIGLVHRHKRIRLQQGDAALSVKVRTASRHGQSAVRFAAASRDAAVVQAAADGDALVLTPGAAGETTVTIASEEDPHVALNLAVRVDPPFKSSAQNYALEGRALPAAGARDVPVDATLRLQFDQAPHIADGGSIRIVRVSDGALADVIRPGIELDAIGAAPDGVKRVVRYRAIQSDGAALAIRPHDGRLEYGTEYRVLVDGNLLAGATLAGAPFDGLGQAAGWTFRTRERAPQGAELRVAADAAADFRTVQGALNHAMRSLPRAQPVTISVANGRHDGLLYLRGKDNVTLRGESRDGAIISAENSDGVNPGSGTGQAAMAPGASGGRTVFLVEDSDLLRLERLTLANTTWRSKTMGAQAEALNFSSEGRLLATDATFLSEQDTIQLKGYAWFYRSLIAGNVDFIWGYNRAALFEESEIRSLGDSANPHSGGYLVQARTVARGDPGFVFLRSRLTHGPGPAGNDVPPGATYLARPGVATAWDNVHYIDCTFGPHIAAQGWFGQPRGGAGWSEAGSRDAAGQPLDLSARKGGAVAAPAAAARFSSRARVFAQFDNGKGWNPQP